MNLRALRYFCAAYETRATVAAALQCHVTQPVISNAIAQLEQELGTRLFVRQARGLQPTPAGTRLYRLGGKLLADAEAIVESFQEPASHPPLSLWVHPTVGIADVQRLLLHWRRELGQMALTLMDDAGQDAGADVILGPQGCGKPGLDFLPLWEERFVLVVPPGHPLAVKEAISLKDLHGTALIERTQCELASHWEQGARALHIVPDVRARVHSEEWAMGLVAAGVGVSLLPLSAAARRDDVVVRADLPELQDFRRVVGLAHAPHPQGILAEALRCCAHGAQAPALQ
jgi:DNA-binding transcriptional LysR family regulator